MTITLQQITGMTEEEIKLHFIDFPPVWDGENEKLVGLRILPLVNQIENAHYLRKFIQNQWNKKLNARCPLPTVRETFPVSMEVSELFPLSTLCPPSIIELDVCSGWLAMAGKVPGIIAFGADQFTALAKSLSEEEEDVGEQDQEDPEARLKEKSKEIKFLFGTWTPIPQALIHFVDPGRTQFNKAAEVSKLYDLDLLTVNFATFDFEEVEEPAEYQIVQDR